LGLADIVISSGFVKRGGWRGREIEAPATSVEVLSAG
jgi:hypothetical protein